MIVCRPSALAFSIIFIRQYLRVAYPGADNVDACRQLYRKAR